MRAKRLEATKKLTAPPTEAVELLSDQKIQEERLIEYLSLKDSFSLADLRDFFSLQKERAVAAQNKSWRSYIPGFKQVEGLEQLDRLIAVFKSFTPAELNGPDEVRKIKVARKMKLAREANCEQKEIENIIAQHQSFYTINKWARARILRGELLPRTLRDVQYLMAAEPSGISGGGRRPAGFVRSFFGKTKKSREKLKAKRGDVFGGAADR